jgi:hypothetical protein
MLYLLGAVARRAVEDDEKVMIGVSLGELLQEHLKASIIHPRQVHAEALSARWLHRCVQISPLVGAFDPIRWTEPERAVASAMPVDQSEARLVESQDL